MNDFSYLFHPQNYNALNDANFYYVSADEIVDGIWLGNYAASQDENFIRSKRIGVIINCSKHIPFLKTVDTLKYNLFVDDPGMEADHFESNIQVMKKHLGRLTRNIYYWKNKGLNVLVHCHAGMQRSAGLVLAYLMRYHYVPKSREKEHVEESYNKSKKHILDKRDIAFNRGTSVNFKTAILHFGPLIPGKDINAP